MKVVIFGATGMVGQGVLRECLLDPDEDGMVWRILRSCETFLSGIEDAVPELCDNDRVRRSRNAERNEARVSQTYP